MLKVHKCNTLLIPVLLVKYKTTSKESALAIRFKGVMFSFLKYITDFLSQPNLIRFPGWDRTVQPDVLNCTSSLCFYFLSIFQSEPTQWVVCLVWMFCCGVPTKAL